MGYKSYMPQVKSALENAKKKAAAEIGTLVVAEAQLRTPVKTGMLRRGETFDLIPDGVRVGSNIPYDVYVEFSRNRKGEHWHPAVYDNLREIKRIAEKHLKNIIGGA